MNEVYRILANYDLNVLEVKFLRHNENEVYQVNTSQGKYILRIHENKEGMQADTLFKAKDKQQMVLGEMALLEKLHLKFSESIQKPISNKNGKYVNVLENGKLATLISWAEGQGMDELEYNAQILKKVGQSLAKLHSAMRHFEIENRIDYGASCTYYAQEALKIIYEEEHISFRQMSTMNEIIKMLQAVFNDDLNQLQIVHGDLSKSNLLYNDNLSEVVPIDFSMSGLCVKAYDLASIMLHFEKNGEAQYILNAYEEASGTKLNKLQIQMCVCYQIILFVTAQNKQVYNQPWFPSALDDWCTGVMESTLKGELYSGDIGLYQA